MIIEHYFENLSKNSALSFYVEESHVSEDGFIAGIMLRKIQDIENRHTTGDTQTTRIPG